MPDPDAVDLDININVGLEGVEKLDQLQNKINEMQKSVSGGFSEVAESADQASEEMMNTGESADETSRKFTRLTGVGLGMLFTFRQLAKPFQSLIGQMMDMGGITDEVAGIMAGPLAEGGQILRDILDLDAVRDFVQEHERLVAIVIIAAGVFFTLASAAGMVIAFLAALNASFISLSAVGIATALAAIAAIGFFIGTKIPDLISRLIDVVLNLGGTFSSIFSEMADFAEDMLPGALGTLVSAFFNLHANIFELMQDVVDYLLGDFIDDIREIGVVGAIRNAFEAAKDRAIEIVKDLADRVRDLVPSIDLDVPGSGAIGRGVSRLRGNDFIMQGGNVVRAHPDDTVLGFKGDQEGLGGQTVNNIDIEMDASISNRMDVEKVVEEVERKIDRRTGGRSTIR